MFSYWNTAIRAYGIVRSFGYDAPKPDEFGAAGRHWAKIGYRADVDYVPMTAPVMPRDELAQIAPLLPTKYSPLHPATGKGYQSVYLAALPDALGELLWDLVMSSHNPMVARDSAAAPLRSSEDPERQRWEEHEIESPERDRRGPACERRSRAPDVDLPPDEYRPCGADLGRERRIALRALYVTYPTVARPQCGRWAPRLPLLGPGHEGWSWCHCRCAATASVCDYVRVASHHSGSCAFRSNRGFSS